MPGPSREILVPFQVGKDGGIAWTADPVVLATQHILAAIVTNLGERVMRPDYGTPLYRALFDSNDPLVQADLRSSMQVAARKWVPDVDIISVEFTGTDIQQGLMQFVINFRIVGSAVVHTAQINVGGTVTEKTIPQTQE